MDMIPTYTKSGKLWKFELTGRRGKHDLALTPAEVSQVAAGWAAHQEAQRREAAQKAADKANEE